LVEQRKKNKSGGQSAALQKKPPLCSFGTL
jgi:hypothetical protein